MSERTRAIDPKAEIPLFAIFRLNQVRALAGLSLAIALIPVALADAMPAPEPRLVPLTHSGPYEWLAKQIINTFRRGDYQNAAVQAEILVAFWDRGEARFKAADIEKWTTIDNSLDNFCDPISHHISRGEPMPDPAKVEAAYNAYVKNLELLNGRYYH